MEIAARPPSADACVDPERRDEQMRLHAEVGGREAERASTLVSDDHLAVHLGRAAEDLGCGCDVSLV